MAELRAITVTWDAEACDAVEVALGPGVSVAEAHHILAQCVDDIECLCPGARISRNGLDLAPTTEVFDQDDE